MRSLAELIQDRRNHPPVIHRQRNPACYDTKGPHTNRFLGNFLREGFQEPFSYQNHTPNQTVNAPYINFKDVKSAVSIRQILEHYDLIQNLKEKGDALSGTCPICQSDSPRCFRVSQEKNCFKCFSCDAGGNILDLVGELESCNIRDAAIKIAEWFDFVSKQSRRGSRPKKAQRNPKPVDFERSAPPAEEEPDAKPTEIKKSQKSAKPLTFELKLDQNHPWFRSVGLKPETVERFGLGYCSKGMMAGRIVFPIKDSQQILIGYVGRWIDGEVPDGKDQWKYPPNLDLSKAVFRSSDDHDPGQSETLHVSDPLQVILAAHIGLGNVVHIPTRDSRDVEMKNLTLQLE